MKISSVIYFILDNIGRFLLILVTLSLTYCVLLIEDPAHQTLTSNDEKVGKTLLIYRSAGKFIPDYSWSLTKKAGDHYFENSLPYIASSAPPKLYKIIERYRTVIHFYMGKLDLYSYRVEPLYGEKIKGRWFFSFYDNCEPQEDLVDSQTGVKIDFVCQRKMEY